jgi:hypothetical protein
MTNTATIEAMRQQQAAPREASMPAVAPGFGSLQSFELMQRAARLLSNSTLVPAAYRAFDEKKGDNPNALANCVVALNMAQRMGADPLMVMQNLYIVEGRPSWSSQWIIAAINGCGRFSPLRFELKNLGEKEVEYEVTKWVNRERVTNKFKATVQNIECVAWAVEKETGERLTSPAVSIEMAVKEGWYGKSGSKWQTMPEVMLRYRTASFFGKLYAPELLMGIQTVEEMQDIVIDATPDGRGGYSVDVESLKAGPAAEAAKAPDNASTSTGEIIDAPATAVADPGDDATRTHEQNDGQPMQQDGPIFEDAIAAVKTGDFDLARDLARSLPEGQQKAVEQAIANAQQPKQRQRSERVRGGLVIE